MQVTEMDMAEVVTLVNEWGTRPCRMDGRAPRPGASQTALADSLHPIFAASDAATRASLVTSLLQSTAVRPELTPSLTAAWAVDDPAQAPRAAAALALRHHLAEHPGRLGVCADEQCEDVYVDASPAGKRRFCCLTCQNRARAAAFRRRKAQQR
ncbi:CGNR zinc finger domain-containing protein [Paractinoplanes lichenicola]|uniref:CGNR zinc finger domain-containing protein n=1 Tax=Paractinoplanes lichenicola TaxID=2802976 RepID=A0ABS1W631_9ACTN|nr:CGNR zinc finger domain-containing protein [Actinoplanes lichenicola]MBL7262152.1 CGNR zinc finger domain-containing protein [Actinoplanes lichenicola]